MTLITLVVAAATITYISRAAATAFLPPPRAHFLGLVERVPAPLFAGLAVFALVGDANELPPIPSLAAALAALAVFPLRSLPAALAAGLAAFGLVTLVL